jgi:hypothetical protein
MLTESRLNELEQTAPATDEYIEFWRAGARASGMFCCVECGWQLIVVERLPLCPGCSGLLWEDVSSTPFAAAESMPTSADTLFGDERRPGAEVTHGVLVGIVAAPAVWLLLVFLVYAVFTLSSG